MQRLKPKEGVELLVTLLTINWPAMCSTRHTISYLLHKRILLILTVCYVIEKSVIIGMVANQRPGTVR